MAAILRRLLGKCCQSNGISNLKAQYLSHSVVFGKDNVSSSSVLKDDREKLLVEDVMRRRIEEFMANVDNSPIYLERKKNIESYIEGWRHENVLLPEAIKDEHWYALLTERYMYKSAQKYMYYLHKSECKGKAQKLKRVEKKEKILPTQGLYQEFSFHSQSRYRQENQWNKLKAWQSDIPVVIDMHFPDTTIREQTEAFDQVRLTVANNAKHPQPLQIHMTSIRHNTRMMDFYESDCSLPLYFYEEHFMDIFPHEKLVYLSPDGPPLRKLDSNMIYVIGGLVDRTRRPRLTYSSAKQFGIQCASLPLANYVKRDATARSELNINTAYDIIQNMYLNHSWQEAFKTGLISRKYNVLDQRQRERRTHKTRYAAKAASNFFRH